MLTHCSVFKCAAEITMQSVNQSKEMIRELNVSYLEKALRCKSTELFYLQ